MNNVIAEILMIGAWGSAFMLSIYLTNKLIGLRAKLTQALAITAGSFCLMYVPYLSFCQPFVFIGLQNHFSGRGKIAKSIVSFFVSPLIMISIVLPISCALPYIVEKIYPKLEVISVVPVVEVDLLRVPLLTLTDEYEAKEFLDLTIDSSFFVQPKIKFRNPDEDFEGKIGVLKTCGSIEFSALKNVLSFNSVQWWAYLECEFTKGNAILKVSIVKNDSWEVTDLIINSDLL